VQHHARVALAVDEAVEYRAGDAAPGVAVVDREHRFEGDALAR
jgi:hypothetical protein